MVNYTSRLGKLIFLCLILIVRASMAGAQCQQPFFTSITSITNTTANFTWTATTPTPLNYEWAISTTATPPTSGTITTATTVALTSLTPGTFYYTFVRANCGSSLSAWTQNTFTTTGGCPTPAGLTSANISSTTADFNWNFMGGVQGYEYLVDQTIAAPTGAGTFTSSTFANATGLLPNTSYVMHLRTKCSATSFSNWIHLSFTTTSGACVTPAMFAANNITHNSATLDWSPVAGASGYEYVINQTATAPTGPGTPTTAISAPVGGLTSSTQYFIHVRTDCGSGFSPWLTTFFYTLATPGCAAPLNLTATTVAATSATCAWSAVSGAVSYEYAVDQSSGYPVSGTITTSTSFTANSLLPLTNYYVHVRTNCTGSGNSPWSTAPFTTTALLCATPAGLSVSGITSTGGNCSWANVPSAIGYEYLVNQTTTPPTVPGNYTTATTATISGLSANTTYYLHVRAVCNATTYSNWNSTSFTTASGTSSCQAPGGISASGMTATGATLNWSAVAGALDYEYVVTTSSSTPTGAGTPAATNNTTVSGLSPSTTYYAHVRTRCSSTLLSNWTTTSFVTQTAPVICTPPTGVSSAAITVNSCTINWAAAPGAAGYEYAVNTNSASPTGAGTALTGTTANISSLSAGTTYYVHVRTKCNATTYSTWTTTSFTTATTAGCNSPASPVISNLTSTSASASWSAVSGALSYEYIVKTTSTPPTTSGTIVISATKALTGLTPNTIYNLFVRAKCGTTNYSAWTSKMFQTDFATNITDTKAPGSFEVYPNPASDRLTIQIAKEERNARISIIDLSGKSIISQPLNKPITEIDIIDLAPGIYLVHYIDEHTSDVCKMIKQ